MVDDVNAVVRLSENVSELLGEYGVLQYVTISESLTDEVEPTVMVMVDDLGPEGVVDEIDRALESAEFECSVFMGQNGDGSVFVRVRGN